MADPEGREHRARKRDFLAAYCAFTDFFTQCERAGFPFPEQVKKANNTLTIFYHSLLGNKEKGGMPWRETIVPGSGEPCDVIEAVNTLWCEFRRLRQFLSISHEVEFFDGISTLLIPSPVFFREIPEVGLFNMRLKQLARAIEDNNVFPECIPDISRSCGAMSSFIADFRTKHVPKSEDPFHQIEDHVAAVKQVAERLQLYLDVLRPLATIVQLIIQEAFLPMPPDEPSPPNTTE
jgi:hypothetical protein